MHEIQVTCPSCKVVHPWVSVDVQDTICMRTTCDHCFVPLQIVIHPGLCFMRNCGIACSGYLSHNKVSRIVNFNCRERTIVTLGEVIERMSSEPEMARIFKQLTEE